MALLMLILLGVGLFYHPDGWVVQSAVGALTAIWIGVAGWLMTVLWKRGRWARRERGAAIVLLAPLAFIMVVTKADPDIRYVVLLGSAPLLAGFLCRSGASNGPRQVKAGTSGVNDA
ncbi:hypothetical protein [Silicimonas algicola]|nr:hypothetical protein [Silicimonas algicola]